MVPFTQGIGGDVKGYSGPHHLLCQLGCPQVTSERIGGVLTFPRTSSFFCFFRFCFFGVPLFFTNQAKIKQDAGAHFFLQPTVTHQCRENPDQWSQPFPESSRGFLCFCGGEGWGRGGGGGGGVGEGEGGEELLLLFRGGFPH